MTARSELVLHRQQIGKAASRSRQPEAISRGIDLSCRFGGEEFVAAFSGVDTATVLQIGERLRRRIADQPVSIATAKGPLSVTISVGAATTSGSEDTAEALLKRADLALYRAKNAKKEGRNRVVADP